MTVNDWQSRIRALRAMGISDEGIMQRLKDERLAEQIDTLERACLDVKGDWYWRLHRLDERLERLGLDREMDWRLAALGVKRFPKVREIRDRPRIWGSRG
jgi:hypothetical protein